MSSSEGVHKRSITKPPPNKAASFINPPQVQAKDVKSLVIAVTTPLLLGIIDAIINNPNQDFYRDLKKPSWNPPGWLFGLAWSLIYPAMGFASWLVWKNSDRGSPIEDQIYPLGLYLFQLILNLLWPYLFFGLHNIQLALIDIIALDVALILCIISFGKVDPLASNIFKPYLAWVSFATLLNYSILTMN